MRTPTAKEIDQAKLFLWNRGKRVPRAVVREFAQTAISSGMKFDELFIECCDREVRDERVASD
jgi:hypothetical protein